MDVITCSKCGKANLAANFLCKSCGTQLRQRSEKTESAATPQNSGFWSGIKQVYTDRNLRKEHYEELRILFMKAVKDGYISEQEKQEITNFYNSSKLTIEDFNKIRDEIFAGCVKLAISDRRVTQEEEQALRQVADGLNISEEAITWMEEEISYYSLLNSLETLPYEYLPNRNTSGLILKYNEKEFFSASAALLEEKVVSRQYVGGSHGVSFRLMKGVTYRVGASRGHLQSQTGIVPVSEGMFTVTSERLVFTGDRKSVNAEIKKLLNIELFSDGLRFSLTNRQKPVLIIFGSEQAAEIIGLFISRILNG